MTDTLSIGWTRSDADRKISAFKRAFGFITAVQLIVAFIYLCLLYTSPSPRD